MSPIQQVSPNIKVSPNIAVNHNIDLMDLTHVVENMETLRSMNDTLENKKQTLYQLKHLKENEDMEYQFGLKQEQTHAEKRKRCDLTEETIRGTREAKVCPKPIAAHKETWRSSRVSKESGQKTIVDEIECLACKTM